MKDLATIEKEQTDAPAAEKKNRRKEIIGWVALVAALILCVFVITQVLSQGYISVGGYSLFRVATGSMEPELPIGSLLISQKTDINKIQTGDIVNFRAKETGMFGVIITHRVINVHVDVYGTHYLETKGDANQYADAAYVEQSNLIGKVVYFTGEGNVLAAIVQFLTSNLGFMICIVLPCLIIGIMVMRDTVGTMKKELNTMKKELDQPENTQGKPETQLDTEEYDRLCERLRNELLEELKQSAAQVNKDNELDSQQQQPANPVTE